MKANAETEPVRGKIKTARSLIVRKPTPKFGPENSTAEENMDVNTRST